MKEDWKTLVVAYLLIFGLAGGMAYYSHCKEEAILQRGKAAGRAELLEELKNVSAAKTIEVRPVAGQTSQIARN